MEYTYKLANASLTQRVVEYLIRLPKEHVEFVTVIHQIDGWVVKVKMNQPLTPQMCGDLRAFMSEQGIPYLPTLHLKAVLESLETGQPPVEVMRRYYVAVVSHGIPDHSEIEAFRQRFIRGLGYCPETLG